MEAQSDKSDLSLTQMVSIMTSLTNIIRRLTSLMSDYYSILEIMNIIDNCLHGLLAYLGN